MWTEALSQPDAETAVGVGGFGYPVSILLVVCCLFQSGAFLNSLSEFWFTSNYFPQCGETSCLWPVAPSCGQLFYGPLTKVMTGILKDLFDYIVIDFYID